MADSDENKPKESSVNDELNSNSKDEVEREEDTLCGIGNFKPQWLQRFSTPSTYLILYSINGILLGTYFSYLIGIISTLEKRFAFKSKTSGVIMMVDEITPLLLGILVGYFGGRTHRPRVVGFGMFLSVICCFLSALPYFIYGPATHLTQELSPSMSNHTGPEMCDYQPKNEECDEDDRPPTISAVVFLMLGSFMKGFGSLTFYTVGMAYMDDNTKKKNFPIYIAISFALRILGPALGFLMSSFFLSYYENPLETPDFSTDDPRWIGAWWLGFVVQGSLLLIFTFPIMLFPRYLRKQRRRAFSNTENFKHENLKEKALGLVKALKRLGTNPLYMWYTVGNILRFNAGLGYIMMLPKYMETQFRLSASDASLYSGPPGLVLVTVSSVVGGFLIWKFRPGPRKLVGLIVTFEVIGTIGFLMLMITSCHDLKMGGTTRALDRLDLQNECNRDCSCTSNVFIPLCGPDGSSTYFSPCQAGCTSRDNTSKLESYNDCRCVLNGTENFTTVNHLLKGYCPVDDCWSKTRVFLTFLLVGSAVCNVFKAAHFIVLLRSVDPQDKSVALGTFETLISLFGFLPYPVIYGALVDSACLVWEESCGKTGNCWIYDNSLFRFLLHGVSAALNAGTVVCDVIVFCYSHRLKNLYEDFDVGVADQQEMNADLNSTEKLSKKKSSVAEIEPVTLVSDRE